METKKKNNEIKMKECVVEVELIWFQVLRPEDNSEKKLPFSGQFSCCSILKVFLIFYRLTVFFFRIQFSNIYHFRHFVFVFEFFYVTQCFSACWLLLLWFPIARKVVCRLWLTALTALGGYLVTQQTLTNEEGGVSGRRPPVSGPRSEQHSVSS